MLTTVQKKAAAKLLLHRPRVIPGTNVIPNDEARLEWFDKVMRELTAQGIEGAKDMHEFCNLAGVPD